MTAQNNPDAGNWTYAYDDAGRPTSQTDAKNQTTTLTYDTQVGRLATRQNAAGTVTYSYSQARGSYSNRGRLTTVTSPADTLQIDYDALGRVVKQDRLIGTTHYVVTRTFDATSLVSIAYPDGDTVGPMLYDGAGRLSSISGILTSVSYDALGRPLTQSNGNGTTTSWTYGDTRGFLSRIQTTGGSGTIQDLQYTQYTDAGLLQQVTSPIAGEGWSYAYDDLNHLGLFQDSWIERHCQAA
jgi:YD repeat-containing protein